MKHKLVYSVVVLALSVCGAASAACFDLLFRACAPRVECYD